MKVLSRVHCVELVVDVALLCSSHITRTTTWEDPRKTLAAQVANQQQRSAELLNTPHPATSPQPQPGELTSTCFTHIY